MNSNPLREFEEKYETFLRVWIRYFFNAEYYILFPEIIMDNRKAMLQNDLIAKTYKEETKVVKEAKEVRENRDRDKKVMVLKDLYDAYILDKREIPSDPLINQMQQLQLNANGRVVLEQKAQKDIREDKTTIWGFDIENISKFSEYIEKMKDQCENQKKKNKEEIEKLEITKLQDVEKEDEREQQQKDLGEENIKLTKFEEISLKNIESLLHQLIDAANKVDIKKSLYHPDNYNLILTSEKDNSQTFNFHGVSFNQKSYPKLMNYSLQNKDFVVVEEKPKPKITHVLENPLPVEQKPKKKVRQQQ